MEKLKNEHPYDDVFNINTSTMNVIEIHFDLEVTAQASERWYGLLFTSDDPAMTKDDGRTWKIRSYNSKENGYHIENIVFENCKGIGINQLCKDPYDEVVFR